MKLVAPKDVEIQESLDHAVSTDWLFLNRLKPSVATRLLAVLRQVIRATLDDSDPRLTWKNGMDEEGQMGYKEALQHLWEMLPSDIDAGNNSGATCPHPDA